MTTRVATSPVDGLVLDVIGALSRLDDERLELHAQSDLPGLARMLVGVHELMLNLGAVADAVEADLAALFEGRRTVDVDGVGRLQRKARYTDSFESGTLLRLLLEGALAEHGADDYQLKSTLMNVLAAALPITPSTKWKKDGLAQLGVDLDEYKARSYGRDRIEIL